MLNVVVVGPLFASAGIAPVSTRAAADTPAVSRSVPILIRRILVPPNVCPDTGIRGEADLLTLCIYKNPLSDLTIGTLGPELQTALGGFSGCRGFRGCRPPRRPGLALPLVGSRTRSAARFEPNTCHHLRKRPVSCEFSR
jgi:hypothetical protein